MSVLTRPRHPLVATALDLARRWCEGHTIDGVPALDHAVHVAVKLGEHQPAAPPELVAAALVHDSPQFAPAEFDLDTTLTVTLDATVTRIVRALEREHRTMTASLPGSPPAPPLSLASLLPALDDAWALHVSTADKVVSLTAILCRAAASHDPDVFWRQRPALVNLLRYFRKFQTVTQPRLPAGMSDELGRLVTLAERAIATDTRADEPSTTHRATHRTEPSC